MPFKEGTRIREQVTSSCLQRTGGPEPSFVPLLIVPRGSGAA